MLTRSIDIDPFDLTIKEKFLRGAKRICSVFAIAALTLGTLDLMNIRSVEDAAKFLHADRQRIAGLLNQYATESKAAPWHRRRRSPSPRSRAVTSP